jgi:glycosyltransferase involved in cell wall biosynthesis
MKTAIVHDWLVTYAGAEKVLEQIIQLYPEADLFSLIMFLPEGERGFIRNKEVRTSFIQRLPFAKDRYRNYLPLMPWAVERLDVSGYDLVISSSYAVAKGVRTGPDQVHISYCYSPMRYAWDLSSQYLETTGLDKGVKGMIAKSVLNRLRRWDYRTSKRVDHFIAISRYIADRIKRCYERDSAVIYPPLDTGFFSTGGGREDFYVTASRFVPYKRIDLIVEAFSGMPDRKLLVIGEGPEQKRIEAKAGKNVELLGYQPQEVLRDYLQRARAFVFAAEEDFGIAPLEAQACGTPVIAFGRGGVTETVVDMETGVFFSEQTVESLTGAVSAFERAEDRFEPEKIRENAKRFGIERFREEFREFVEAARPVSRPLPS